MTQAPVLALADFLATLEVECDASGSGIGAAFMQKQRLIAYFSTTRQGKSLSTYEKELMALVLAVKNEGCICWDDTYSQNGSKKPLIFMGATY